MDDKEMLEKEIDEINEKERELAEKAAVLEEKEKELAKREEVVFKNAKEKLYDKIHIPVKVLDIIILACFVGIVAIFLLKGNW